MLDVAYLANLITAVLQDTPFLHLDRALPLLLGTAAQESGLTHFRQLGGGPGRGLWQMEPPTFTEHWRWLRRSPTMRAMVEVRTGLDQSMVIPDDLWAYNLPLHILMARLHYYRRDPAPLPAAHNIADAARRWKLYYNTPAGKGTEAQYVASWHRLVAPHWPGERTAKMSRRKRST